MQPATTRTVAAPAAPPQTWSGRAPRPWLFPVAAYAATWVLTLTVWWWLTHRHHGAFLAQIPSPIRRTYHGWELHFVFKDTWNYLDVARHGYPATLPHAANGHLTANNAAFFPLLPAAVKALAFVFGGSYPAAALTLSLLTGAGSAWALWRLADRLRGRAVADRAVVLYCLFPGAFVFGFLYSEPAAIMLAALCLSALVDHRWVAAGTLAAIDTALRPNMVALCVACLVAAVVHIRRGGRPTALAAPLLSPLGALAYLGWGAARWHDWRFWFRTQSQGWGQRTDWGVSTMRRVLWLDGQVRAAPAQNLVHTVFFAVAVIGVWWLLHERLPAPVTTYTLVVLALSLTASAQGSKPRFVWVAFPVFVAAGTRLRGWVLAMVLVLSAGYFCWLAGWSPLHYGRGAP